jgi:DNA integrity scanning protein DisA with diadenylate cyclase activity
MFNEEEVKEIEEAIAVMEDDLQQAKADLKKKKYGALREAIEARNSMDKVVQEELTKLNLTHNPWTVQPSRHLFWR